jgi:hypothetical protein
MRELTRTQATNEIQVLDKISDGLRDALRQNYDDLRANNPAVTRSGGDIEIAAKLHNIKLSLNEALEEVGRRGYGRVIFVRQEDDAGNVLKNGVYRVSQANASLPEASIIARNSPLGSQIASCRVGEELEIRLPGGERYFVVTSLVDIEGAVQLLRPNPDIKLARFQIAGDPVVDVIRGVRAFLEPPTAPAARVADEQPVREARDVAPSKPEAEATRTASDLFWPSDWSRVVFADEPDAALGSQFFTRTTREQEDAIRTVRGVTAVHGIAGTGKTSVALGRLKFFANFRSGEHMRDYGLNPNDWADFDSSDMIGFVLSPSLIQYLKQTAEELEMRMKIMDFEEYRNQERQSRRLFGRPYKRSPDTNDAIQQTVLWLRVLADAVCLHLAEAMEATLREPLSKPETPDGVRTSDARWQNMEGQFWRSGPLRARILGLSRGLKGGSNELQGLAASLDRDVRLSDHETASLNDFERRALREAVLNVSLRFFRLLNPTELYVEVHKRPDLSSLLAKNFPNQVSVVTEAAAQTARRLEERLVTDGDVVTALCLNALACDGFERDIKDIPYVRTFSDRIGVFIDEYQDFSEQQVFLMGYRAKRKYRQITVAGDLGQQLHVGGLQQISHALPYVTEPIRQIMLDTNFRQSQPLARLSDCFRAFTTGEAERLGEQPVGAPMHTFQDRAELADFVAARINSLPGTASVVVISPNAETTQAWFELMAPSLESSFRNPIVSDRARLTERLKTHFTTPLQAKGLEFDVAVVPDISEFNDEDLIQLNGLYVAVSRPRHAITLGCRDTNLAHRVVKQLCQRGDLVPASLSADLALA